MLAFAAAQPQKAVGKDAPRQEAVELVLDKSGQLGPSVGFGVRDEAGRMLLHQAVQRSLLWAGALLVARGAVRRPFGAVGRRLAREAPEVGSSEGLKPFAASQSPCRAPTYDCQLAGGHRHATVGVGWQGEIPGSGRPCTTGTGRGQSVAVTPGSGRSAPRRQSG